MQSLGFGFYTIFKEIATHCHLLIQVIETLRLHKGHTLKEFHLHITPENWYRQRLHNLLGKYKKSDTKPKRTIQIPESQSSFQSTNWWDITHAEKLGISLTIFMNQDLWVHEKFPAFLLQIPQLGQEKKERKQNKVGLDSTLACFQQNNNEIISKSKIHICDCYWYRIETDNTLTHIFCALAVLTKLLFNLKKEQSSLK